MNHCQTCILIHRFLKKSWKSHLLLRLSVKYYPEKMWENRMQSKPWTERMNKTWLREPSRRPKISVRMKFTGRDDISNKFMWKWGKVDNFRHVRNYILCVWKFIWFFQLLTRTANIFKPRRATAKYCKNVLRLHRNAMSL